MGDRTSREKNLHSFDTWEGVEECQRVASLPEKPRSERKSLFSSGRRGGDLSPLGNYLLLKKGKLIRKGFAFLR